MSRYDTGMFEFLKSVSWPEWVEHPFLDIQGLNILSLSEFLLVLMVALLVRNITVHIASTQLSHWLLRLGLVRNHEFMRESAAPLGALCMAAVLALTVPEIEFHPRVLEILILGIRMLACVSSVWLVYRSVDVFAEFFADKAAQTETKLDDQLVPLLRRALKISTVVIGGVFVLQNLNVDVSSLLTGMAVGGLAFSLAAKDTVSNLFGSVTIFVDKPFSVGDQVLIENVEGFVEHVGFRSTRIRTFQNSLVTVPNHKFTESIVDNFGLRKYRRVQMTLGVLYSTKPDQIQDFCDGIREIIKEHPKTRKDFYEVNFVGFGDSSLNILLYFFLAVPNWQEEQQARHAICLDIVRLAANLGVDFAFPTRTVHMAS